MSAPATAPPSIAKIAAQRRCHRRLLPPAKDESAASPAIVRVRTVVVKSGTPSFRTTAVIAKRTLRMTFSSVGSLMFRGPDEEQTAPNG